MDTTLRERYEARRLEGLIPALLVRGWTLHSSTLRTGNVMWVQRLRPGANVPRSVEGKLRPATLEACRMELAGPVTQPQSPSGAEPSPAVPSSPVSASTSRRAS
jgi:hypothetical protein